MATIDKELLLFKIDSLCAERNITRTTAFLESGVGKNFKSNLSSANPSLGKLTMLANYFNVSVEYLKGETEQKEKQPTQSELSEKQKRLIKTIEGMSDDQLDRFEKILAVVESTEL